MRRRRQENETGSRGPWYLLTGLVIGLGLGALIGWVLLPVQYTDTAPATLRQEYRRQYTIFVAEAYAADGDLGRAQARVGLLQLSDPGQTLAAEAQQMVADNGPSNEAHVLALLASALIKPPTPITPEPATEMPTASDTPVPTVQPSDTPDTSQAVRTPTSPPPTSTPLATLTPRPTAQPSPTLGAPYRLGKKSELCDPASKPLITVWVSDAAGQPVAGVRIYVTWGVGLQDSFLTGLYPEKSPGYADFAMSADTSYSVRVGDAGQVVSDLSMVNCTGVDGTAFQGGWKLEFNQP